MHSSRSQQLLKSAGRCRRLVSAADAGLPVSITVRLAFEHTDLCHPRPTRRCRALRRRRVRLRHPRRRRDSSRTRGDSRAKRLGESLRRRRRCLAHVGRSAGAEINEPATPYGQHEGAHAERRHRHPVRLTDRLREKLTQNGTETSASSSPRRRFTAIQLARKVNGRLGSGQ